MASKKGAMRALGRVVRNDEAANEVVAAGALVPIISLLDCNDAGVVRRYCYAHLLVLWLPVLPTLPMHCKLHVARTICTLQMYCQITE